MQDTGPLSSAGGPLFAWAYYGNLANDVSAQFEIPGSSQRRGAGWFGLAPQLRHDRRHSEMFLNSKLAQMMIQVAIHQSSPRFSGKPAERGMRFAGRVDTGRDKRLHRRMQRR